MQRIVVMECMVVILLASVVAGCGKAEMSPELVMGPYPELPDPEPTELPVINLSEHVGWPEEGKPVAPSGYIVKKFADELDHPRWLYTLPNGDILVAETNAPERPDVRGPVEGPVVDMVKGYIGTGGNSADRITLLRDEDGDGRADIRHVFLENLHSPFGLQLVNNTLYVGNTDAIWRFPYQEGELYIEQSSGEKVVDLPAGTINYHWTKNIVANPDNPEQLFVTVGSNSNIGERGMDVEKMRAAVLLVDTGTEKITRFAHGLRNPNGMAIHPESGELWVTVNERDNLGHNLAPDYMTSVEEGDFFGWPWSYFGENKDPRVEPENNEMVEKAIKPDYSLGAHTAPLGLVFYDNTYLGDNYSQGAFVALHGSYNRVPKSGYKVIFVPFRDGVPVGMPLDFLVGFLNEDGDAYGRPAGLTITDKGALLVADDVSNRVWYIGPVPTQ